MLLKTSGHMAFKLKYWPPPSCPPMNLFKNLFDLQEQTQSQTAACPMISNSDILQGQTNTHVTWEDCLGEPRVALPRLRSQVDAVPLDETRLGVSSVILPTQSEGMECQVVYGHMRVVHRSWEGSQGKKSQDLEILSKCPRTIADANIHGGSSPLYSVVYGVEQCIWLALHVCRFNQTRIESCIFQC